MGRVKGSGQICSESLQLVNNPEVSANNYFHNSLNDHIKQAGSKKSLSKDIKIRRTERIKREKPDYFDILKYERQARREKKKKAKVKLIFSKQLKDINRSNRTFEPEFVSNRMLLKKKKTKKRKVEMKPPKEEEFGETVLSKETLAKFDSILQDINRKIYASSWRIYT